MSIENWFFAIGALLFVSIAASRLSTHLGVPVLLVFLALGMLMGSDGPGGIWFSDAKLASELGVIALAFILFSGGMDLDWSSSQPYVGRALSLATVGVGVTAAIVGIGAHLLLGLPILEGLLLGAIVASTDAAAVFSTLRLSSISIGPSLRRVLEMESGSNDPAAVFLTLLLVDLVQGKDISGIVAVGSFIVQITLGIAGGWVIGRLGVVTMRKLQLDYEGMYHGLSMATMLCSYGGAELIGGNGFMGAYVAGIAMGNGDFKQKKGLRRFHDGVAWLMQIGLFIVLGLLVFPSELPAVAAGGLLIAAVLLFIARPLGVFVSLLPFRVPRNDQLFLSWSGLRGAVPIVLATFPMVAGLPRSQQYFNIVFFVVLISAVAQGPTIARLAWWLHLDKADGQAIADTNSEMDDQVNHSTQSGVP